MDLPSDVELMFDLSASEWVIAGLKPWDRGGITVASLVPDQFDAYARIPHAGEPGRYEGDLPGEQMAVLIPSLADFTSTRDRCWYCIWTGYGFWFQESHGLLLLDSASSPQDRTAAEYERRSAERDRVMRTAPSVAAEGRDYFLFRGPLAAAGSFDFDGFPQSPNLWWPEDRSWCVATEIDFSWTLVGGSRPCIDRLLTVAGLSATEVRPDDKAV